MLASGLRRLASSWRNEVPAVFGMWMKYQSACGASEFSARYSSRRPANRACSDMSGLRPRAGAAAEQRLVEPRVLRRALVARRGLLDPGVQLLPKRALLDDLLDALREVDRAARAEV